MKMAILNSEFVIVRLCELHYLKFFLLSASSFIRLELIQLKLLSHTMQLEILINVINAKIEIII